MFGFDPGADGSSRAGDVGATDGDADAEADGLGLADSDGSGSGAGAGPGAGGFGPGIDVKNLMVICPAPPSVCGVPPLPPLGAYVTLDPRVGST
jgi:hypothetical protein